MTSVCLIRTDEMAALTDKPDEHSHVDERLLVVHVEYGEIDESCQDEHQERKGQFVPMGEIVYTRETDDQSSKDTHTVYAHHVRNVHGIQIEDTDTYERCSEGDAHVVSYDLQLACGRSCNDVTEDRDTDRYDDTCDGIQHPDECHFGDTEITE